MKLHCVALVSATLIAAGTSAQEVPSGNQSAPLRTTRDQASYAIGLNIGRDLKGNTAALNVAALLRGIQDILTDTAPRLSAAQCQAALTAFEREMAAKSQQQGVVNQRKGMAFLGANKRKPGVVTLPSGLQYKILKRGTGPSPKVTDTVKTHYHGTLIDGTVFDSSVQRGEPIDFKVGNVIRGWIEALQLMKVGGKWQLFIPSELAYGNRSPGPPIEPHSVLVFEIELLGIQ